MMSCYKFPVSQMRRLGLALMLPVALLGVVTFPSHVQTVTAQTSQQNGRLTISADMQEYNANTQVATARGNVQMLYPARQIKATSAQAQFFSRERRIDLSGNVHIVQNGVNSIQAEKVSYLIDEGRFVALPQSRGQVQSIYMVNDSELGNQSN
ncbi:OstA family protein [Anabaenopsis arnoldii]|uniref:OstA family protein n=2 Tax=Anabaenopsis arnoldii TaxID=2152938 RepID=A0ABT5AMY2_9CYAN|nr:OstA family protein [Anabaenopsis arnoldii]MDB9538673.1 OstA family protein [Anabaenopsis arnoldii]MDH6090947.1 OstA family protein [Anabaenopsis arnoldii]